MENDMENEESTPKMDTLTSSNASYSGETYNYNPQARSIALMNDEEYINERLVAQMDWYDRKSSDNKKKYKRIKRTESVIAALIPVLITFGAFKIVQENGLGVFLQVIAALAGVALVIMNSFLELDEHHKLWKEYRVTCEMMRHERYMCMTRSEPYDEADAFPLLVEKIEAILNSETQRWKQIDKKSDKQAKNPVPQQGDKT
jgi:ABC-type transport system involved in cytochrome bd biosynthesis fused ATPase/permease subunit